MCRAMMYLGERVTLDDLLFKPDSSLVNQAYMPRMLHMLNLAGFGMMAWDSASHAPLEPHRYRSPSLPVFDGNLKSLAVKTRAECVIAHVRGVAYSTTVKVSEQNTHPFHFPGAAVAMAHNGDIYRIGEMKGTLMADIAPDLLAQISGSTDSEWVYALLLSQLPDWRAEPDGDMLIAAVQRTVDILEAARRHHGIAISSSCNLFLTTGRQILGLRHCFDFGRYRTGSPDQLHEANMNFLSMWFTTGRDYGLHDGEWQMVGGEEPPRAIIVASEPLSSNSATWMPVPEYAMVHAEMQAERPTFRVVPLAR
ncbi:MAG TPA: class II glutamine amidotransferase [Sphingopyxis sp.]|nr:class II glutamine amidotransferase [Sphingopyxis sp.]